MSKKTNFNILLSYLDRHKKQARAIIVGLIILLSLIFGGIFYTINNNQIIFDLKINKK